MRAKDSTNIDDSAISWTNDKSDATKYDDDDDFESDSESVFNLDNNQKAGTNDENDHGTSKNGSVSISSRASSISSSSNFTGNNESKETQS